MNQQESIVREQRTIEATRKNMLGASGKLGTIAKFLGHKIIKQGTGGFDQSFIEDPFYEGNEENIPVLEDTYVSNVGYHFDGLSRGIHFEISYSSLTTELKVSYKGYLVFQEISGDLYTYVPFDEWEDIVENLYYEATERAKKKKEEFDDEKKSSLKETGKKLLHQLRMRWGI